MSSGSARMAMGMPMSLLWLTGVLPVRYFRERMPAIISLVVLLPTEPVTPTTFRLRRIRSWRAMSPRAFLGSLTTMAGKSPSQRLHSTAAAPAARAPGINSWPSRAPSRATNSWPGSRLRESLLAPKKLTWAYWGATVPPHQRAACSSVILLIVPQTSFLL